MSDDRADPATYPAVPAGEHPRSPEELGIHRDTANARDPGYGRRSLDDDGRELGGDEAAEPPFGPPDYGDETPYFDD